MVCEYCDGEVPVSAKFCPSCGAPVHQIPTPVARPTIVAQPIGTQIQAPQMQDQGVAPSATAWVPHKSRVVYILLGLFLGVLGIHNFYAGRLERALGQLLVTLFTGWLILPLFIVYIWVICDVCAITTDGSGVSFG